jgi:hypothetical protein
MNDIKISLCASALRPAQWKDTYNSLKENNIEWELIYAGPNPPIFELPKNFIYIQTNVKPAQCYQISFNAAKGELISWTADDALYPPQALDNVYKFFKSFNNKKLVVAFRTIEDGRDITEWHRLRGKDPNAPRMAPFGIMNREFFNELGGYDRRFMCGQSENDVVMRAFEAGGNIEISKVPVIVNHQKAHDSSGTVFRSGYFNHDRSILENSWIRNGIIQKKRLDTVERFVNEDILTKTQSYKGIW